LAFATVINHQFFHAKCKLNLLVLEKNAGNAGELFTSPGTIVLVPLGTNRLIFDRFVNTNFVSTDPIRNRWSQQADVLDQHESLDTIDRDDRIQNEPIFAD